MNSTTTTFTRTYSQATSLNADRPSPSSRIAAYTDPDLLIKDYFLKSDQCRAESRSQTAQFVKNFNDLTEVLMQGARARNGYDGAVNLLAELSSLAPFKYFVEALKTCGMSLPETWIEIIIKAIACAYKLPLDERFALLNSDAFADRGRMIKASLIDAMLIVVDEADPEIAIRTKIESYLDDSDSYIREYAKTALAELD